MSSSTLWPSSPSASASSVCRQTSYCGCTSSSCISSPTLSCAVRVVPPLAEQGSSYELGRRRTTLTSPPSPPIRDGTGSGSTSTTLPQVFLHSPAASPSCRIHGPGACQWQTRRSWTAFSQSSTNASHRGSPGPDCCQSFSTGASILQSSWSMRCSSTWAIRTRLGRGLKNFSS